MGIVSRGCFFDRATFWVDRARIYPDRATFWVDRARIYPDRATFRVNRAIKVARLGSL